MRKKLYDAWTRQEIKLLEDNFGKLTKNQFIELSKKTEHEVTSYFLFYGVSSKGYFIKEPKPIKIANQDFLTIKDFADKVCYNRATVGFWIREGKISFKKIGKLVFIPKFEIERFEKLEKIRSVYEKLSLDKIERIYNIVEGIEA